MTLKALAYLATAVALISWQGPGVVQGAPRSGAGASTSDATVALTGTLSPWLSRATKVGPADENQRVVITAYLRWKDELQLAQLLRDRTTPGGTRYGDFLSPAEFHAAFSPDAEDVTKVQTALQALGFKIEQVPVSGLFVVASGTVTQVKAAFQVSQNVYLYRGKSLRSHAEDPTLPASLAGVVTYIGGLDDSRLLKRPASVRGILKKASSTPSLTVQPPYGGPGRFPCSHYWGDTRAALQTTSPFPYSEVTLPWVPCGYTPQQISEAYGSDKIPETGRGVRIAITDVYASPTLEADVNRYSGNHHLPPLTRENFEQILQPGATAVPASDPCGYQDWWEEETLDVTAVHSMAPDAHILYVGGACDAVDSVDAGVAIEPIYEVIDGHMADIVTNSWLYNEEGDVSPGELASDNAEFIQAALQGMSVLFASGDDGDMTLQGFNGGPNPEASGNWPATSPYVTAVGGTSLLLKDSSGRKSEYGWANYETVFNDPLISPNGKSVTDQGQGWLEPFVWAYGSGGGPSLVMPQPWYQKYVVPRILATRTFLADGTPVPLSPARRVTPDISMLADPFTGMIDGETYTISAPPVDAGCTALSATTEYCEAPIGGTSLATPLLAGVLALVNEHRFFNASGPIGFINAALYCLPVGVEGSHAPIIDVNAPSEPIGSLGGILGYDDFAVFLTVDSNPNANGVVIENVDSSLRSAPGYDNVTGLGVPNIPAFIRGLER